MSEIIKITIDNKVCIGKSGQYIVDLARENDVYIPTLCNIPGLKPRGACRMCTVRVNGKLMTACTTPAANGMQVESETADLRDFRSSIIELMFAEGNHLCPSCEKSGNCELQALGYKFNMNVPRFPYQFPERDIEASHPRLIKDHNRCILCKRCIRAIKTEDGRSLFAFTKRGPALGITLDPKLAKEMSAELAEKAINICPVGALLPRNMAYQVPVGERKFDKDPIGIEKEVKPIKETEEIL